MVPSATTTEFGAALAILDITQAHAGRLFQVTERHVRRWKRADRSVPVGVAIVLRLLTQGAVSLTQVELAAASISTWTNGSAEGEPLVSLEEQPAPLAEASQERSLRPHVKTPAPAPVPANPGPITLAEKVCRLTAEVCHWPLGDPRHATFCFCSAPVVTPPYCPRHYAQAITPAGAHGGPSGRRLLPSANINQDGARTPAPAGTN